EILEKKIGGAARFLVEEKLVGEEFSLQAVCVGRALVPMPLAQDHKRAYEGDKGPNTGGMGSYSDADHRLPFLTNDDFARSLETMTKSVVAMAARGTPFKGILYGGFMATKDGPKLLEYNVRFADPESMNVLPILETDFLDICARLTAGNLPTSVTFARKATVCKYVVPMGYGSHQKPGEHEPKAQCERPRPFGPLRPVSPGASNGALSPRATRGTEGPELRWRLGFGRCLECHTSQPSNNGMGHPRAVKNLDDVISEI